jgi:hypothetical protein
LLSFFFLSSEIFVNRHAEPFFKDWRQLRFHVFTEFAFVSDSRVLRVVFCSFDRAWVRWAYDVVILVEIDAAFAGHYFSRMTVEQRDAPRVELDIIGLAKFYLFIVLTPVSFTLLDFQPRTAPGDLGISARLQFCGSPTKFRRLECSDVH